jgi:2-keto-4-pentenoate hydratase/2-oxohepta-3-ene-1,7-dioic acid hydratase in catechol pathway
MRLARVRLAQGWIAAVQGGGHWVSAAELVGRPMTTIEALANQGPLAAALDKADIDRLATDGAAVPITGAALGAPMERPGKILAIGLNYVDHIREVGAEMPSAPVLFGKFPSSIAGPYDDIGIAERLTQQADYEVELAVVIGTRARDVAPFDGIGPVAGYMVANDVSSRDNQFRESQWIRSKSFDGFCPIGPWITTVDEIVDPQRLDLSTTVNGELRQSSNTSQMLFGVADLVSFLSQGTTLEPGDVILTGTPPGVAAGMAEPAWLEPGDVVRCEIERLGYLENHIVRADADEARSTRPAALFSEK